MKRFAAIDIGTNTVLMLVADVNEDGTFRVVTDRAEIPRLGEGVDGTRSLSAAGVERALKVLIEYVRVCERLGVGEIAAVGTSALRDARNTKRFIARLKRELNLSLRVLSGAEEAAYSYLSVREGLRLDAREILAADVGGGSTEFIRAKNGKLQDWASLDLGSVRLTERYLRSDPASGEECARLVEAVDASLGKLREDWGGSSTEAHSKSGSSRTTLVGIAGTFTTLAAVEKGLRSYSHSEVHGSRVTRAEVERQARLYRSKTLAERRQIAGLEPERADVILAGTLLIERIMRCFGADDVVVSDQGIRYGLLYEKIAVSGQPSAISKKNKNNLRAES
jgi:exopolyphosphatase/guanosine-5'-triphosphate,3'-diphosphate pyrophosphatase